MRESGNEIIFSILTCLLLTTFPAFVPDPKMSSANYSPFLVKLCRQARTLKFEHQSHFQGVT